MALPEKYTPIFNARTGDDMIGNASPETLTAEFTKVAKMFDPTAIHASGNPGGIHKGNLTAESGIITDDNVDSANVAGKVVGRDSFGNFAANEITANKFIGLLQGNADTATNANHAITADIATNGCPAGAVMAFARSTPPTGWLECNGAAVSRTTYAALFAAIGTTYGAGDGSTTFNLPDLRDEFIRGWDHGRGGDSGRTFGSTQTDAFQGHWHEVSNAYGEMIYQWSAGGTVNGGAGGHINMPHYQARSIIGDGVNGAPRIASETRPRNVALMYCIKY